MKSIYDTYTLNNGQQIPCVGFGTWKAAEGNNTEIIARAIEAGYRYFDTASFYGTEPYIGQALTDIGIDRSEFYLVSKVWKTEMGYEETLKAFEGSLRRLQTDYLDLYLIHWPKPEPDMPEETWKQLDIDTWRALEDLYEAGKVKAIGLSNFLPHHVMNILEHCRVKPMVNQLEIHPGYTQAAAARFCQEQDILVQAWSPMGRQRVFQEPLLQELAAKYQVSVAQMCLRFILQKGMIPLPKATAMERMKQNMNVFGFEITAEDMSRIETLPQTGWSGEHPDRARYVAAEV